jgi:hypothetical protein
VTAFQKLDRIKDVASQLESKRRSHPHRNPSITPAKEEAVARAVLDEGKSLEKAAEEFGVGSVQIAKIAVAKEQGRRESNIYRADLSLTVQQKLEIAIRQRTRDLEAKYERRVRDEVQRRLEQTILPRYKERVADADRVLKARKGVIDRATYRKIRACLHPDRVQDPELKARYEEAFNLFNNLESVLLDEKELPTPTLIIPTTLNELMKLKKKMAERRTARHGSGDVAAR